MKKSDLTKRSHSSRVSSFLGKLDRMPAVREGGKRGRLVFSMDATASREPMWDRACRKQRQMFEVTESLGGLNVQLCYYHGFDIFYSYPWVSKASTLLGQMSEVCCVSGHTQIYKVLEHALSETRKQKVNAVVFIGDYMEENASTLCGLSGQLGMLGVPMFIFHEGGEIGAENIFRRMASLSGGAYCRFDAGSADFLAELLGAVAVYAAGGRKALDDYSRKHGKRVLLLTDQMSRG